jgi:cytochrome oxidase Cu insertion factor (SCO1/SenC/PrrC family)
MHRLFSLFWGLVALLLAGCASAPANTVSVTPAPGFTLPADDGRQVSLSDYAGKPVLLYFHMAMG